MHQRARLRPLAPPDAVFRSLGFPSSVPTFQNPCVVRAFPRLVHAWTSTPTNWTQAKISDLSKDFGPSKDFRRRCNLKDPYYALESSIQEVEGTLALI